MTREEVIQIMGPPLKEYDVRPDGKTSEALYREMLFKFPTDMLPKPYVDLDIRSQRVVEVFCTDRAHITMPEASREELGKEAQAPLPTAP